MRAHGLRTPAQRAVAQCRAATMRASSAVVATRGSKPVNHGMSMLAMRPLVLSQCTAA